MKQLLLLIVFTCSIFSIANAQSKTDTLEAQACTYDGYEMYWEFLDPNTADIFIITKDDFDQSNKNGWKVAYSEAVKLKDVKGGLEFLTGKKYLITRVFKLPVTAANDITKPKEKKWVITVFKKL